MCVLGGLWKKLGHRHFECAVCGQHRRGWRTWFMIPKEPSGLHIPEPKIICITAFNVDQYCGMHPVTLAVILREVEVDDYPALVNKLKEQHPDVEIVYEAKF